MKDKYIVEFYYSLFKTNKIFSHRNGFDTIELELEKKFTIIGVEKLIEKKILEEKGLRSKVTIISFERK